MNRFDDVNAIRYCFRDLVLVGVRSQVVDGELEVARVDCRNRQGCNDPRRKLDDVEEETVCGRFCLGLGESMGNSLCRWNGQGGCHDQVIDGERPRWRHWRK
jgi:hypothetical protein